MAPSQEVNIAEPSSLQPDSQLENPSNNSGAGTSGGAGPVISPVDFVIEQQASEMPSIFESDGGD